MRFPKKYNNEDTIFFKRSQALFYTGHFVI